ncbi:S8 family serine peptidase [Bacillus shivajii]|uniref:S8 family peptidase n=1 Tax=Bacillus shivajii TaxID=1983719 RepID=UPI001CF93BBE|nr:S8 family serine peptidase [Bacillus shivajii]UCZ54269.1 S8 family serine peptidase [Bacillus shivajii]
MKKLLSLSIMILMLVSLFAGTTFAQEGPIETIDHDYIEGQLVISVSSESIADLRRSINSPNHILNDDAIKEKGFEVVDSLLGDGNKGLSQEFRRNAEESMGFVFLIEYATNAYESTDQAKNVLDDALTDLDLDVRYVTENMKMHVLEEAVVSGDVSVSMHDNQEWHYEMINAPQAWDITTGSNNVRMAVLDTGIDSSHPNLSNLVDTSLGRSFVGGDAEDRQGHGTHVAGTIASYGSVSGVMQEASLVSVKVLDDNGSGTLYGIQEGILYAADINSDVMNMSLGGGGYNQGMDDAVQTAVNAGTIVVAASGNDSSSNISYPAAYSGSIAVGSVTSSGTRSSFSNYGDGLELMAPGSDIYSTYPNGQYATLSGTSMASPHVAGVAGLMRAVNPDITVSEARSILQDTAQNAGSFYEYGHGIVDAYAAVQLAGGDGGTQPDDHVTHTTVSTDKEVYDRGDDVTMTATVVDGNNSALQGATVTFTITRPNGSTVENTVSTNSSGIASWTIGSNDDTALGDYNIFAETTLTGYEPSSDSTVITFGEAQSNETVTTVSTNYSWYYRGENVTVSTEVTDSDGQALANATVDLTITRPNGSTISNTVTTDSNGFATWTLSTSSNTAVGEYHVLAETTLTNYESSSDTTSFHIY